MEGMKNPPLSGTYTNEFVAEALDNMDNQISEGIFPELVITDAKSSGTTYLKIHPDFYNCLFTGGYEFEVSGNSYLPAYSDIVIYFPNDYGSSDIPATPTCYA